MSKYNKMIKYLSEQLNPNYPTNFIGSENIKILIQDGDQTRSSFETTLFATKYMIENLELHWEIKDNDDPFLIGNTVLTIASTLGELIRYDVFDDDPEFKELSNIEVLNKLTNDILQGNYFKEEYEQILEDERAQRISDEKDRQEEDIIFQELLDKIRNQKN